MKTKTIISMMLALVTMQGLAQTKTATITGYSPALKDGTLVIGGAGSSWEITDSVKDGHFSLTVPVDELSMGGMVCIWGENSAGVQDDAIREQGVAMYNAMFPKLDKFQSVIEVPDEEMNPNTNDGLDALVVALASVGMILVSAGITLKRR
jgi:hypothetical protein